MKLVLAQTIGVVVPTATGGVVAMAAVVTAAAEAAVRAAADNEDINQPGYFDSH